MIHKYMFRDEYIVLDVNSGAVHVVDPVIYDILDFCEIDELNREKAVSALTGKYSAEDISDALSDIDELIEQGMLFSKDDIPSDVYMQKDPVIKAMCLHVAHDCNMDCAYCFGDKGAFEGIRCILS